jgi:hypothetical protein
MKLDEAQELTGTLSEGVRVAGIQEKLPIQSYLPLTDELSQLRARYNRYLLDPTLYASEETNEESVTLRLVIEALATIYSSLVLPVRMIDAIANELAKGAESGYDAHAVNYERQTIPRAAALAVAEPGARASVEQAFREIESGVIGYIGSVDGQAAGNHARRLVREFLGGD